MQNKHTAIYALELLINRILKKAKIEVYKVVDTVTEAKPERKDYREVFRVKGSKETAKEAMPEMPVKSVLASKFHRLTDIYHKLEKQNEAIYEREQQLGRLENELANAKGIFKGKQRKELQEQIEQLQTQIGVVYRGDKTPL